MICNQIMHKCSTVENHNHGHIRTIVCSEIHRKVAMGRKKNSAKARSRNLPSKPRARVEEAPDDGLADVPPPPQPEKSPQEDGDDEAESDDEFGGEMETEDDLAQFTARLQTAHSQWVITEREKAANRKRKKHYDRKSDRTQRRRKQARRELKAKGFPSVLEMWNAARGKNTVANWTEPETETHKVSKFINVHSGAFSSN